MHVRLAAQMLGEGLAGRPGRGRTRRRRGCGRHRGGGVPFQLFETELEHRFSHQLHRHSITGGDLSERLNRMEALGILQPSVARAAHDWRLRLNAEHHCFQGATIEDQRGTANELREFIYLHLTPAAGG